MAESMIKIGLLKALYYLGFIKLSLLLSVEAYRDVKC
jgi:hypothetical protein